MKYSCPVDIENLKELQRILLARVTMKLWSEPDLYPIDHTSIPEIQTILSQLKLADYVEGASIIVVPAHQNLDIHIDHGTLTHSLNIPIINCLGTWTIWYATDQQPQLYEKNGYTHLTVDPKLCREVERVELATAHLFDVKQPHDVENPLKRTRISLAIRLSLPREAAAEFFATK